MKNVSLGAEDFAALVQNCYYVDHSFMVEEIERTAPSSAILFLRPRRFGKSLMLSLLSSFYQNDPVERKNYFLDWSSKRTSL